MLQLQFDAHRVPLAALLRCHIGQVSELFIRYLGNHRYLLVQELGQKDGAQDFADLEHPLVEIAEAESDVDTER